MDLAGRKAKSNWRQRKPIENGSGERGGTKHNNGASWRPAPNCSSPDCNCDPRRRKSKRRQRPSYRVSLSSHSSSSVLVGKCPKLYLLAVLAIFSLCLSGLSTGEESSQVAPSQPQADQSQPSGRTNETKPTNGACLPLIGALFGIGGGGGGRCEPQTETATSAPSSTTAATVSRVAMRYESLKVNQSAGPAQRWNISGQQVKEAASLAPSDPSNAAAAAATTTTTDSNNATGSSSNNNNHTKPQQQQQQQQQPHRALAGGSNLNVLCNSRCNCVILDLSSQPATSQLVTPMATSRPSLSAASASPNPVVVAAFGGGPGSGSSGGGDGSTSNSGADQADQALIAFNEDYSLDYEQTQPEQEPEQQQQQPPILSAGPNPSKGPDETMRQPQLQPSPSHQVQESGTRHQPPPQQQQLSPAADSGNLQVFPLQHHPHAGSGGNKASSAQLYAQSLFSSQAPKLSYHAHTPYLKHQPSVVAAGPQNQQKSANSLGAAATAPSEGPSGGGQSNQRHYAHHPANLRAANNHHHGLRHRSSQPPDAAELEPLNSGRDLFASRQQQQQPKIRIKGLIPLVKLNASNWEQIRQTETLSSFLNGHQKGANSSLKVPESALDGLESLLAKIEQNNGVESLILSHNNVDFEYWTELYALLMGNFRKHLYHLDLSHNSIVKLGITFTGYLEHHIVAHNGLWQHQPPSPISNPNPPNTTSQNELSAKATSQRRPDQPKTRSSLFDGGRLYSLMQSRLQSNQSHNQSNHWSARNHTKQLLSQPMLIRALDLSFNKLKWLINDQFKALKHVQTIRLDHNRIRYIHQHAFSGLESLRFLNLNYNRLQVIYIEQFQTNYNLLALMLRSNHLAYLRGGSFASLSQLKRLDLSQNKLTILSNNAFIGLESLEHLNCSSNEFAHVPSGSFHSLTSLKKLDLSDNLISELAPGTFFHLPVEELWLGQNDQLVTIERGALWDLPYLSRLHLNSNPMLANINSQSFVSTQSLQFIDVDGCQSLDANAKQLLENITMAATSRQLRLEQQQQQSSTAPATTAASNETPPPVPMSATLEPTAKSNNDSSTTASGQVGAKVPIHEPAHEGSSTLLAKQQHLQQQSRKPTKYLYYMGTIGLLIVALTLVFKYTSTSHYVESRRRRRRIYELDSGQQQHQNGPTIRRHSISSASQVSSECDSVFVCGDRAAANRQSSSSTSFELYESANNVILERHHNSQSPASRLGGQQPIDGHEDSAIDGLDVSVINVSPSVNPSVLCCPDCDGGLQQEQPIEVDEPTETQSALAISADSGGAQQAPSPTSGEHLEGGHIAAGIPQTVACQVDTDRLPAIDLIHSQLVAAGFDCGHANCAHFYQSLGPALQLADMTANFVNNLDYY